jgi:hypothetical protein
VPAEHTAVSQAIVEPGHVVQGPFGWGQSASVMHACPQDGPGFGTHCPLPSQTPKVHPLVSHAR